MRHLQDSRVIDASCDPGVGGVKCLAKAPPGSQILSLVVDDTTVYFAQVHFVDSGEPVIEQLLAATRTSGDVSILAASFPTASLGLLKDDAAVYSAYGALARSDPRALP